MLTIPGCTCPPQLTAEGSPAWGLRSPQVEPTERLVGAERTASEGSLPQLPKGIDSLAISALPTGRCNNPTAARQQAGQGQSEQGQHRGLGNGPAIPLRDFNRR